MGAKAEGGWEWGAGCVSTGFLERLRPRFMWRSQYLESGAASLAHRHFLPSVRRHRPGSGSSFLPKYDPYATAHKHAKRIRCHYPCKHHLFVICPCIWGKQFPKGLVFDTAHYRCRRNVEQQPIPSNRQKWRAGGQLLHHLLDLLARSQPHAHHLLIVETGNEETVK
jgi:hypothetical protein